MDANFSILENWKLILGVVVFFTFCIFITIKFVKNNVKTKKVIKATNGSVAADGGIHAPININSNNKK